jgi:hypothetical protein
LNEYRDGSRAGLLLRRDPALQLATSTFGDVLVARRSGLVTASAEIPAPTMAILI